MKCVNISSDGPGAAARQTPRPAHPPIPRLFAAWVGALSLAVLLAWPSRAPAQETYLPWTEGTAQPVRFAPGLALSTYYGSVQRTYDEWKAAGIWNWVNVERGHWLMMYVPYIAWRDFYQDHNVRPSKPADPNDPAYRWAALDNLLAVEAIRTKEVRLLFRLMFKVKGNTPRWLVDGRGVVNHEDNGLGGAVLADDSTTDGLPAWHREYVEKEWRYFATAFGKRYKNRTELAGIIMDEIYLATVSNWPSDLTSNDQYSRGYDEACIDLAAAMPNTAIVVYQVWSWQRKERLESVVNIGFGCADARLWETEVSQDGPWHPDDSPAAEGSGYYRSAQTYNYAARSPQGGMPHFWMVGAEPNGWKQTGSIPAVCGGKNNILGYPTGTKKACHEIDPAYFMQYHAGVPRKPNGYPGLNNVPGIIHAAWLQVSDLPTSSRCSTGDAPRSKPDWATAFAMLGPQGLDCIPEEPYGWESQIGPPGGLTRVQIHHNEDDAEERLDSGQVSLYSSDLELVRDAADQLVGLRFPNVPLPQAASVASAYLEFATDEPSEETTSLTIRGQAADHAAPFAASAANLSARSRTTARTAWAPGQWSTIGKLRQTPDIAAVIQEIVNRPGWQPGNALVILISGTGRRVAASVDGSPGGAPLLVVTCSTPSTPAAPSALSAAALAADAVRLAWQDNSSNEAGFKIDRRQSGTDDWVRIATTGANATTYTDSGLPAGTKFYYMVKAANAEGNSPYSSVAAVTTPEPPPVAPANLVARVAGSTRIALSWADRSGNETGFKIDRRQSGTTPWVRIATAAANGSAWSDTGLPPDTRFYYLIKATNAGGDSAYANRADATTLNGTAGGSVWRYRKGTAEASNPATVWRGVGFDDSGWASGAAPFGYGDGPYGTELTDMQGRYACLFLRHTFQVDRPAAVAELHLNVTYDDGFIIWLNGQEVARQNVGGSAGDFHSFNGVASDAVGNGTPWRAVLTGAALPELRSGANVVAVQVFNASLADSSDLTFDGSFSVVASALSVASDEEGDGMPDAWEASHLSKLPDPSDRTDQSDPDADGLSNLAEYIAGTDPADPADAFEADVRLQSGRIVVSFATVPAAGTGYEGCTRRYVLEQRPVADVANWVPVPGYQDITGDGQTVRYLPPSGEPRIYRARVWLQDR
ncbi:MAG: fibronectin type III domain-containing protein [Kiritimatiellae bacterium]|nr:fibronectin type III domain-containing protein [Kiritimatiellia bacterium]